MNSGLVKREETREVDMPNLVTGLDMTPKYILSNMWLDVVGHGSKDTSQKRHVFAREWIKLCARNMMTTVPCSMVNVNFYIFIWGGGCVRQFNESRRFLFDNGKDIHMSSGKYKKEL